jgi:hypothetical protein
LFREAKTAQFASGNSHRASLPVDKSSILARFAPKRHLGPVPRLVLWRPGHSIAGLFVGLRMCPGRRKSGPGHFRPRVSLLDSPRRPPENATSDGVSFEPDAPARAWLVRHPQAPSWPFRRPDTR